MDTGWPVREVQSTKQRDNVPSLNLHASVLSGNPVPQPRQAPPRTSLMTWFPMECTIRHESGRPIRQISICPSLPLHNLTRRPPRPVCSCSETPQDIRQLQRKKRANRGITGVAEMLGRWLDDWVTACWDGVRMELHSWQITEHCVDLRG